MRGSVSAESLAPNGFRLGSVAVKPPCAPLPELNIRAEPPPLRHTIVLIELQDFLCAQGATAGLQVSGVWIDHFRPHDNLVQSSKSNDQ